MSAAQPQLAPVRYGAVKPGTKVGPLEAVRVIMGALVDENGVNLGLSLTEDQAFRLVHDLELFGWKVFEQRSHDTLYNNPGLCLQVIAAVAHRETSLTVTQEDMNAVAGKLLDYTMADGRLDIKIHEPRDPN